MKFKVGDKAYKPKGYKFPCIIVAIFKTTTGETRIVGEMVDNGMLHIFNENQLELQAMNTTETDLSETDKELIAEMDKRLKHLETLLDEALSKETPESLTAWLLSKRKQPAVDVVEPEKYYREWTNPRERGFTVGKIYKAERELLDGDIAYIILNDNNEECVTNQIESKPSTKEAYLKQFLPDNPTPVKEVEKEWKVGEWAWDSVGKHTVALITGIENEKANVDDQSGWKESNWDLTICVKPTENEIFTHLKGIAERKYPVGTKFKSLVLGKTLTVKNKDFQYLGNMLCVSVVELNSYEAVWDGKWAEIISEPKQEERWDINIDKITSENFALYITLKDGNLTEELAQSAATKIREILLGV